MLFNSYIFILFFLPLCVSGYFFLNRMAGERSGKIFLLGMSLWFYGYMHASWLLLISFSILANYMIYRLMAKASRHNSKKWLLCTALFINLGLLIYFKYMDFFISNINFLFSASIPLLKIALPLGISFFTFQQISFIVDAYKGQVPEYSFLDYAVFVTFFPQLVAGPIVTHEELIPQLQDPEKKKVDWDSLARGISLFSTGLVKKMILADNFGNVADWGYGSLAALDSVNALIVTVSYTLQIYFDFSGYCDMALGIGRMLNIDLPENFRSPYKARTITEFWERWHITLTRFFTKYVYIPLGGNRKGSFRMYRNTMAVFLLSGLWHGADWSFVIWGAMHGLFFVFTKRFQKVFDRIPAVINWLITFSFVNAAWIFFRAESLREAVQMLRILASGKFGAVNSFIFTNFQLPEFEKFLSKTPVEQYFPAFLAVVFYLSAAGIILFCKNSHERMMAFKPKARTLIFTVFLMIWGVFSLSGISQFLYFNF